MTLLFKAESRLIKRGWKNHLLTFDNGFAKVKIYKIDGDYKFEYEIINLSEQLAESIEILETYWHNDTLAAQFFLDFAYLC